MSDLGDEIRMTQHLLAVRSGQRCEWCGQLIRWGEQSSMHHRQPRGSGGTTRVDRHSLAVLVLVHGHGTIGCHWQVEQDRDEARERGFLVSQHGTARAADVPIVLASGRRVSLDPVSPLYLPPADGVPYRV